MNLRCEDAKFYFDSKLRCVVPKLRCEVRIKLRFVTSRLHIVTSQLCTAILLCATVVLDDHYRYRKKSIALRRSTCSKRQIVDIIITAHDLTIAKCAKLQREQDTEWLIKRCV